MQKWVKMGRGTFVMSSNHYDDDDGEGGGNDSHHGQLPYAELSAHAMQMQMNVHLSNVDWAITIECFPFQNARLFTFSIANETKNENIAIQLNAYINLGVDRDGVFIGLGLRSTWDLIACSCCVNSTIFRHSLNSHHRDEDDDNTITLCWFKLISTNENVNGGCCHWRHYRCLYLNGKLSF